MWGGGGGKVFPCMGFVGSCLPPKGMVFLAILVIKWVSIWAIIFFLNGVWILHSCLEFSKVFRRSYFFIIIDTTINKSPSKCL